MEALAAVSWSPDRIDLFWVDAARALWHRAWRAGSWGGPESLGGTLASGPAATTWVASAPAVDAVKKRSAAAERQGERRGRGTDDEP
jgi:hypothetical protein